MALKKKAKPKPKNEGKQIRITVDAHAALSEYCKNNLYNMGALASKAISQFVNNN